MAVLSTALSESGTSLVTNSNLISKIYFPRLVVPHEQHHHQGFVDFMISRSIHGWHDVLVSFRAPMPIVLLLPLFVLLAFHRLAGVSVSWIAALMVKYRDLRFIVPFIVQFGLYISAGWIPPAAWYPNNLDCFTS